jgi:hypothetical protein
MHGPDWFQIGSPRQKQETDNDKIDDRTNGEWEFAISVLCAIGIVAIAIYVWLFRGV